MSRKYKVIGVHPNFFQLVEQIKKEYGVSYSVATSILSKELMKLKEKVYLEEKKKNERWKI